jgi:tRNA(Ile)-lysidine synthase
MSLRIENIPAGKILVAVSGGVDSMVLLHLLSEVNKKNIIVVHVNHNMRGKESDDDQVFVEQYVKNLEIPIYSYRLEHSPKNEEEAREVRYNYFNSLLESLSISYVALAHHLSDQSETLLLQMIRGTHAFSPMLEYRGVKWRPLLSYSKLDIIDYAKAHSIPWREDLSNKDQKFSRNRLRNNVIPELKKINSNFEGIFLDFSHTVFLQNQEIQNYSKNILRSLEKEECVNKDYHRQIERKGFLALPSFLQSSIVKQVAPDLYKKHIEEVLVMIQKGVGKKKKHGFFLCEGFIFY